MKKLIIIALFILVIGTGSFIVVNFFNNDAVYTKNGISMVAKTEGKDFLIYHDDKFEDSFLKGVNMGAAKPGTFPGELAITYEMYMQWFEWIHEMGADVIRVYTTLMPDFYDALYDFNQGVDRPLYVMQGVWLNENDISSLQDAYGDNRRLLNDFVKDAKDLVDIIHGNAYLEVRPGFASGEYTKDVSPYVIGWILGVEWDPQFVFTTNAINSDLPLYNGEYLKASNNATPFENFLAEVGDKVIKYEVDNYSFMRPLSYVNWPTTDPLNHPNEPDVREDLVSVTLKNIISKPSYYSGIFASYHIYPYYPEFMNYSLEYKKHVDHRGELNAYQGYLSELIKNYDIPVMVAEFGVPSSRGKTHEDINMGFNQGYLTEKEQGEIIVHMLGDIYQTNYAGAMIFTWQDEWFKRTWNTMDLDLPHRRPFWSNIQTNEQHFGVLAFDPGHENRIRYVDGDISDWENDSPLHEDEDLKLYTAFDERYMYVNIVYNSQTFNRPRFIVPISTSTQQGNNYIKDTSITFSQPADFIIDIQSNDKAEIKVDAYYDAFQYIYMNELELSDESVRFNQKNTGVFNPIYQALSNTLYLPQEDKVIPFSKHRTGILNHGNANPEDVTYNSLADYHKSDGIIEIKIPWQLLNISDPSTHMKLSDFYADEGINSEVIESMYIGVVIEENGEVSYSMNMVETMWDSWSEPSYHMRLKPSYYIVKEAFKHLEE